jgi:hypothetical protein
MKKNYIKIIVSLFTIIIIFSFSQKIEAVGLTGVSYTQPSNNAFVPGVNNDLSFTISFDIPVITPTPKTTEQYALYFQPYIDGVKLDENSGAKYIYYKSKSENMGKRITQSWKDVHPHSFDSKIYSWKVYDTISKIEYIPEVSFTYKLNTNYAGFYYVYKIQSQTTTTERYYSRSSKFVDLASCEADWNTFLAQNPNAISYTTPTCKKYDNLPFVPENEEYISIDTQKSGEGDGGVYKLLAPIGDLKEAPKDMGDYFNTIFKIAIGLCGALAVIMIVIGGVQYMGNESIFGQTEAKGKITAAILGLIIALGSYALLNTINPALLGKDGVKIAQVSAEISAIEYISPESFTQITGKKALSASEYDAMGRKVAKEVGIPFCAIRVILERESKGNPGAIGFDENVRNSGIPSRVAFVNSGKKYNGETFTPSSDLIGKKGFINQSKSSITNTPGLGIDWRFSKGLGLTQITLFPDEYSTAGYKKNPPGLDKKDNYPTRDGLTPRDLLDPEKNLKAGAKIWKQSWVACNKDIYGSWVGYGRGPGKCSTSNDFLKKEAATRTEYYNGCPEADKQV